MGHYQTESYQYNGQTCFRYDRYIAPEAPDLDGNLDRVFTTNTKDNSPIHNNMTYGEGAGYDPDCSCCFLGFPHSENYHKQSLERHEKSMVDALLKMDIDQQEATELYSLMRSKRWEWSDLIYYIRHERTA
uniref:Uncharacterized protein n=1 Tax=viral metagenome TaxID=1070528 RepID=A0A6M3IML6_9ZZZZ